MTSRERIIHAINHEKYDGLAIDFGAMRSTGINAMAYNKLVKYLGYDECACVYDIFQQLALPSKRVVDRMGGDVMQIHRLRPAFGIDIKSFKEATLQDGSKCTVPANYEPVRNEKGDLDLLDKDGRAIARMPQNGFYFDQIVHRFAEVTDVSQFTDADFPTVSDEELDFMEKQALDIYENTDKAILLCFGGNIFEQGQLDFGYEQFFVNIAIEKELMHEYFSRLAKAYLIDLEKILSRIGKYVNVIQFGDDLGTQLAPQISVDMYREMIMPYHKVQYCFVKEHYPDVKVFLHSCGAIFKLIPSLIEAGVQILNPVQISADGMDPVTIKEEFGKSLVFWGGGADMQRFVQTSEPEQISAHVKGLIDIWNSDGTGFVFTQVHNIQYDVPPQKVCAIYDTALKCAGR